ncbi:MAG: DedA family protein [Actinobacteria bacterium]|nr:DedA family protein [Actinomycetota bacterium]
MALGPEWLSPENLIGLFGAFAILGVCIIVFIETGLLVGFFLPGDSLLFTAGLLMATGVITTPIWIAAPVIGLAAFIGDQVGYQIGKASGPRVFNKPDSRFFRREYVDKTHAYFERFGGRTIIIARFIPIVRTFAPVVAGVARMPYRTFVTYNFIGALLWGVGVTLLGYWLGGFEFVQKYIEIILIAIVAISAIPIFIELGRAFRNGRRNRTQSPVIDGDLA